MLAKVVEILAAGQPLPAEYHDHILRGDYVGCHECHIAPDWLLVYEIVEQDLLLYLTRTGTHSDLF
jgi:mRNA interferase YafQ